jgi:tetratricopeptide (TPR) repeat protein
VYQFIYHIIYILINPQYFINVEQKNDLKVEFNLSFREKDYEKAIDLYIKLNAISNQLEPELKLNAANSYYILNDTLNARLTYENVLSAPDIRKSALAYNQLGALAIKRNDTLRGLEYFKKAIEQNPDFEVARYNYELMKILYKPKNYLPPPPNFSPENVKVESSEEKIEELELYQSKNISKEKALQLLDDLKYSEKKISIKSKNSKRKIEKDW